MKNSAEATSDILLSIDPSLRSTGYAVLSCPDGKPVAIEYGTIANARSLSQSGCLGNIFGKISALVEQYRPSACSMEGVIYVQSHRTAITLGAARAASIIPVSLAGIPISEYSPKSVKQAVVGRGGADKAQVAFMVRALLGLSETPAPDAADALAIGLTHLHGKARPLPLQQAPRNV